MTSDKAKSRYFTFILYPDSLPTDWVLKLESLYLPIAISPLHDQDEKEKDLGDLSIYKKPHYHVIYVTKNPVTTDAVRRKIQRVLGKPALSMVKLVESMESMYLYLTHESKDALAKKKHIYNKDDIQLLNNFDIDRYIVLDENEKQEVLNLLTEIIYTQSLENIFDLRDFIAKNQDDYAFPSISTINQIVKSNSGFLRLYFDGAYQTRKRADEKAEIEREKNSQ